MKDLFTGRLKTEIPQALQSLGNGMTVAGANLAVLDCSDNALGPNGMTGLVDLLKSRTCFSLQVITTIRYVRRRLSLQHSGFISLSLNRN